jgi:hypothetical protein
MLVLIIILFTIPAFLAKFGKNCEKITPAPIWIIADKDIRTVFLMLCSNRIEIKTNNKP